MSQYASERKLPVNVASREAKQLQKYKPKKVSFKS